MKVLLLGVNFKLEELHNTLLVHRISCTISNNFKKYSFPVSRFDSFIIEIDKSKDEWIETVKYIRNFSTKPIIITTNSYSEDTQSIAHELGVNWCVVKPYSTNFLLKLILFYSKNNTYDYKIKNFTLSRRNRNIVIDSTPIHLTKKEYLILNFLIENTGLILSKDIILDSVWGNGNGNGRLLDAHIKNLRKKLLSYSSHLATSHSFGFFWTEYK